MLQTGTEGSVQHQSLAGPVRPVWAVRNFIGFIRDKEDTAKVIGFFRAVDGDQPERNFERFCAARTGRDALARKTTLGQILSDRDALGLLPEGTLGRAYFDFMEAEKISVEGLKAAGDAATRTHADIEPARVKFRDRLRDQHDLWHVLTGYGRDALGEICLLAFSGAQTGQRGFRSMALFWGVKEKILHPGAPVFAALREGRRLGLAASWLIAEEWETLLHLPLADIRRRLKIGTPHRYQMLFSE